MENYKLLEEKLQDIILMRRGLLIPHPRDEYDLLEERILESLELKTPRLLKCGHFVPPEDDTDNGESDDESSVLDDNTGRGSRMSGGTFTEERETAHGAADNSMCVDCHHELKRPGKGVGAGTRRWDIKIYAANGLMRANAWAACWGEMERCDVELQPWIPDDLRKTLERRVIEEQEAEKRKHMYAVELQRQIQESTSKQKIAEEEAAERKRLEEVELQKSFEAAAAALQRSVEEKAAEKKKFEDSIQAKIDEAKESMRLEMEVQAQVETTLLAGRLHVLEAALQERAKPTRESAVSQSADASTPLPSVRTAQIPLSTLLKNYILVLLKDQRNFIILVLGALVVFLAMNMETASTTQVASISAESSLSEPVHMLAVTTTATTTATEFSTLTVTEIQAATSVQKVIVPTSECAAALEDVADVEGIVSVVDIEDVDSTVSAVEKTDASLSEEVSDMISSASESLVAPSVEDLTSSPVIPAKAQTTTDVCVLEPIFSAQCAA